MTWLINRLFFTCLRWLIFFTKKCCKNKKMWLKNVNLITLQWKTELEVLAAPFWKVQKVSFFLFFEVTYPCLLFYNQWWYYFYSLFASNYCSFFLPSLFTLCYFCLLFTRAEVIWKWDLLNALRKSINQATFCEMEMKMATIFLILSFSLIKVYALNYWNIYPVHKARGQRYQVMQQRNVFATALQQVFFPSIVIVSEFAI